MFQVRTQCHKGVSQPRLLCLVALDGRDEGHPHWALAEDRLCPGHFPGPARFSSHTLCGPPPGDVQRLWAQEGGYLTAWGKGG